MPSPGSGGSQTEEFETDYSGRTFTVVQLATLKGQLLS